MPGYGGGIGGDNAPGNEAGAGGGSGMGGGMGGMGPGIGPANSRINTMMNTKNRLGITPAMGMVPGAGMLAFGGMLSRNLADMFGAELGPVGPTAGSPGGMEDYEIQTEGGAVPIQGGTNWWEMSPDQRGAIMGTNPYVELAKVLANVQQGYNTDALRTSSMFNQVGQVTPFGTERWEGEIGSPDRRRVIELNPADQAVLDRRRGIRGTLLDNAQPLLDRISARWAG